MKVQVTKSFRIQESDGQRTYTPGEVVEGTTAQWAIKNGYGREDPESKAQSAPNNKSATPPKNK